LIGWTADGWFVELTSCKSGLSGRGRPASLDECGLQDLPNSRFAERRLSEGRLSGSASTSGDDHNGREPDIRGCTSIVEIEAAPPIVLLDSATKRYAAQLGPDWDLLKLV
jgi:hypothetical protein